MRCGGLVARQMGKPCLVGCSGIQIDADAQCARIGEKVISAGDWITVEGNEGYLYLGRREIVLRRPEAELAEPSSWQGVHRPEAALS
jgi:pyruvate, orthophosphate dikinase